MFATFLRTLVVGSALSLAAAATPALAGEVDKAPLVLAQDDAAAGGGRVWFAFMWPDNLKPQLEERRLLLTLVSFLPFGSVWGPIVLLGQSFDMEWALVPLVYSIVFQVIPWFFFWTGIGFVLAWIAYLVGGWLSAQVMFANLNRPEIPVGGGEPAVQ